MKTKPELPDDITATVARALTEDIGDGDRNAALVDAEAQGRAVLSAGASAIVAGTAWFDAVFTALDADMHITWQYTDAQRIHHDTPVCTLTGRTRALLTGERTALNFLQMLSGVATTTHAYVERLKGTQTAVVDSRQTLPGLRSAQQYAVQCGGGEIQRCGLYDAIVLNDNHIAAAGCVAAAVRQARAMAPELKIQVAATTLEEVDAALEAGIDAILLDSLPTHVLTRAVNMVQAWRRRFRQTIDIGATGDISLRNVREIADTGVDTITIASLTRHIQATDYAMRISPA